MKQFAQLFTRLDQTNKTNEKVEAIKDYFQLASDADKTWTLALFTHKRPRKQVKMTLLREWVTELAQIPPWLFEESYHVVGDLGETISLLLPSASRTNNQSLSYWIQYIKSLGPLNDEQKKEKVMDAWDQMTQPEQFVFTKLMTGSFRVGVSQNLITRSVAEVLELDKTIVAHRIMGTWKPEKTSFEKLVLEENEDDNLSRPYPFFLASPLEHPEVSLGDMKDWQAEWKWDGIRSQIIFRQGKLYIWSRGEELVTEKFPELHPLEELLPDGTVIDGELLPFADEAILPFSSLQTRIGRKNLSKSILKNAPVIVMAYDILEWEGKDIRTESLQKRRKILENLYDSIHSFLPAFRLSPIVEKEDWESLHQLQQEARTYMAEGFMLKNKKAPYQVGRKRGDWWKWKIAPLTVDGVLINAQRGSGKRAGLYTDYTFGVWNDQEGEERILIPFAKAYSGLTDEEIRKVDNFVKRHTKERFGPVRSVTPELVFEIAFEGIQESKRHKSGVAVRFPRMLRWRHDKKASEANTLSELQALLDLYGK